MIYICYLNQIIIGMTLIAVEEMAHVSQKPKRENVIRSFGTSFLFNRFNNESPNSEPVWHYHPEIEIAYVEKGSDKRHVGNHISYDTGGELVMIGPNLPHYGFTDRFTDKNHENIIQFHERIFGEKLLLNPEFKKVTELLRNSRHGLSFFGQTKKDVGVIMDQMTLQAPFERFLSLIKILKVLSESEECNILNVGQATLQTTPENHERVKVVFEHVMANFQTEIKLAEVASLSNMTIPSFCRFFKKRTGKTLTQFVNEFRVIHACKLLSETSLQISDICFESGFNNFANFNKQFKNIAGFSPSAYRSTFREVISG